jgi:hypothetical protein
MVILINSGVIELEYHHKIVINQIFLLVEVQEYEKDVEEVINHNIFALEKDDLLLEHIEKNKYD